MSRPEDDAAWQDIVANYGDRPVLDPSEPAEPAPDAGLRSLFSGLEQSDAGDPSPSEEFVPPPPPPLPRLPADRLAAWAGVLVSPCLLLVLTVLRVDLPVIVSWLLVASFLGGFGYLVATMPRGPRDPFDDGARL